MAGDGSFVTINEDKVGIGSMWQEILDTIAYTRDFADEMRSELTESVEELKNVVSAYKPKVGDLDFITPTIQGPGFPNRPSFPPLDLDDGWPSSYIADPAIMDYGNMNFDFVAPPPPQEISANFNWSASDYSSEMWFSLFSKVHNDILNGGTGLSPAVHAAIVAREKETRRVNQDREYRKAIDAVGANGFNLPSGQVAAVQIEVARENIAKDQDALNNLTIKDFDLATENTRFAITTGADLEKILRAAYEAAENRSLEAEKAAKEYIITVYQENVKLFLAKFTAEELRLKALGLKIDAISARNDGEVKVFLGRGEMYKVQIEGIVAKNKGKVDVRQGEVDVYKTSVEAVTAEYQALVEEVKVQMEGVKLEINAAIELEKVNLEAYTSETELAQAVAEAVSRIATQSIASALGAIHTSLGNSYQGSENRAESWRHGETLGETHSYTEL